MDWLTTTTGAFATIVGLLSNYKAERSGRRLDEFLGWLRTNHQEQLAAAIAGSADLSATLTSILSINHQELLERLSSINERIIDVGSRVDGFAELAKALDPTRLNLNHQELVARMSSMDEKLVHVASRIETFAKPGKALEPALTRRTAEHCELLIAKTTKLITLLDSCPISDGREEEFPVDYFNEVSRLATDMPKLAASLRLEKHIIPPSPFHGFELSTRAYVYVSFLHALRAPRLSWTKIPGGHFGRINVLKLPDELIEFKDYLTSYFDENFGTVELRQSTADWTDDMFLRPRQNTNKVLSLASDKTFQGNVDRTAARACTKEDADRLLQEIREAAINHAGDFAPKLHSIAATMVLLEAAAIHLRDDMKHWVFESELAKIWDAAESLTVPFTHSPGSYAQ